MTASLKRQRRRYQQPATSFTTVLATMATLGAPSLATTLDDSNIHRGVREWLINRTAARHNYGHISYWDTSQVTNMDFLFLDAIQFDEDLSRWNVSQVTSMVGMFQGAVRYSGNLDNRRVWDTSKVQSMEAMFRGTVSFRNGLGLSRWDTANVQSMKQMFQSAHVFALDSSQWQMDRVTDLSFFLDGASSIKRLDISGWNVEQVTSMDFMFYGTPQLQANICFPNNNQTTADQMLCCSGVQFTKGCDWVLEEARTCTHHPDQSRTCSRNSRNQNSFRFHRLIIAVLSLTMIGSFLIVIWNYIPIGYIQERSVVLLLRCCGRSAPDLGGMPTADPTEEDPNLHVANSRARIESHC